MRKTYMFALLVTLFLASCGNMDISNETKFKNLVGHSIVLRRPQNLYEIDYQLNGYRDRYELGGYGTEPLVGVVLQVILFFLKKLFADSG